MITPAATAPELTARGYQLTCALPAWTPTRGRRRRNIFLESETAAYCYRPRQTAVRRRSARAVQDGLKKGNANVVFFDVSPLGKKISQRWWRV